jgi:hypothetical protein
MKTDRLQNEKRYDTREGTPVRFHRSDVLLYREIRKGKAVEIYGASAAEIRRCIKTGKF